MKEVYKIAKKLLYDLGKEYEKNKEKLNILNAYGEKGNNIYRRINIAMSYSCEDLISILIAKELKEENYLYIVDTYLSYKNGNSKHNYRPDIIIVKVNKQKKINEIVGIVEVKAQMGYCKIINPSKYETMLDILQNNNLIMKFDSDEKIDKNDDKYNEFWNNFFISKQNNKEPIIKFKCSRKTKVYIVNFLSKNHVLNVERTIKEFDSIKPKRTMFYTLYNETKWYDNLNDNNEKDDFLYENSMRNKEFKYKDKINIITNKERYNHGFEMFVKDINKLNKGN